MSLLRSRTALAAQVRLPHEAHGMRIQLHQSDAIYSSVGLSSLGGTGNEHRGSVPAHHIASCSSRRCRINCIRGEKAPVNVRIEVSGNGLDDSISAKKITECRNIVLKNCRYSSESPLGNEGGQAEHSSLHTIDGCERLQLGAQDGVILWRRL